MTPVQEVCRKLWRPTPPLQHLTRQLQRWPRVLRKSARSRLLLLDLDTLGLVLRRQRASLPNKIIPRAWRTPETGSPSKTFSHGWMQEVCRIALALPPLQHELLTNVFDLLFIRPSRSLQPCPRPLLVPPLCVPRLFRLLPPSLVLLSSRVKTPHVIFAAPHSADEILDFIVDPVFLSTFCVDIDFNRDSGTETVFSSAVQGGNAAQTGLDRARLTLHVHFEKMRPRKLANHLLVLPQPDMRAQDIHASLLHVVLGASHATLQ